MQYTTRVRQRGDHAADAGARAAGDSAEPCVAVSLPPYAWSGCSVCFVYRVCVVCSDQVVPHAGAERAPSRGEDASGEASACRPGLRSSRYAIAVYHKQHCTVFHPLAFAFHESIHVQAPRSPLHCLPTIGGRRQAASACGLLSTNAKQSVGSSTLQVPSSTLLQDSRMRTRHR